MSGKAGFRLMVVGFVGAVIAELRWSVEPIVFLPFLLLAVLGLGFWLLDVDLFGDEDE